MTGIELFYSSVVGLISKKESKWIDTAMWKLIVDPDYGLYEPFILASQATQVFYAPSVSRRNEDWCSVITTKARNTYHVSTRDEENNIEPPHEETYQEDENPTIFPYVVNENLDNVPLCLMGLGEEVEDDFLNVLTNILDDEDYEDLDEDNEDKDEDEDEVQDEDEDDDDDENEDNDDSMDVDD